MKGILDFRFLIADWSDIESIAPSGNNQNSKNQKSEMHHGNPN
jgi:hypothetical protein